MHSRLLLFALSVALSCAAPAALAQRHSMGSSPPTPPPPPEAQQPAPIEPVSSGLGPLQFFAVNYAVPSPPSLTHQLESDDDRTRASALAALGAPAQYLTRGHIPYPHSLQLEFAALGSSEELDAILTVELDQHLVSAILVPEEGNWRRVGTMLFATAFDNPATNPSNFLRTDRALVQHTRYRAIFHGSVSTRSGDFIENEAHLQVVGSRAVVTISFVSTSVTCGGPDRSPHSHTGCDFVHRWLQPDTTDPQHRFLLVTGSGHISPHDEAEPIVSSRTVQMSRIRFFSCQPFEVSPSSSRFEPTAPVVPCNAYPPSPSPVPPQPQPQPQPSPVAAPALRSL